MRTEIIDLSQLTDSRELMLKKSPPAVSVFVSIIAIIVAVALVWACFGEIDTYVSASGEIRTQETVSTITLSTGGKLKEIFLQDGSVVKKGEAIFTFESDYYKEQKNIVSQQISDKETDIDNYNRLISAIKEEKNTFNESTEQSFYYQYLSFKTELDTALTQISESNKQNADTKAELNNSIYQAKNRLKEVELLYKEFSNLYSSIKNDTAYNGKVNIVIDTYNIYASSREKAKAVYDNYLSTYEKLIKLQTENPNSVTEEQLSQAEYSKNSALADLDSIKLTTLSEISNQLMEIEAQITTYNANITSYTIQRDSLTDNKTTESTTERIKDSYYLSINSTIEKINSEVEALNVQLLEIEEAISNCCIKAMLDGTIVFAQDISVGDILGAGTTIAKIVPKSDNYQVVIYIPEYNISSVGVGQTVEFSFTSISVTDYGKVYGEILTISDDSFMNQADGQKFYKAIASIEKTELINKYGEKRIVKTGMLTDVRMITGKQRIIFWLLDKLNFV